MNENNLKEKLLLNKALVWPDHKIKFEAPIADHASWFFQIYNQSYKGQKKKDFPRGKHDILHVARAAMWSKIFINLYKKFDPQARELDEMDEKLLGFGVFIHDLGRERSSGKDLWDLDSALFFYFYLKDIFDEGEFNLHQAKIRKVVEALANKDAKPGQPYYRLNFNGNELDAEQPWMEEEFSNLNGKNIYEKIIHDSDCLDIIRVRFHFDRSYLDSFQDLKIIETLKIKNCLKTF